MKRIIAYITIEVIIILLLPLAILTKYDNIQLTTPKVAQKSHIKVYDCVQDKVLDLDVDEYIKCVVASEMPALFEEEALKAQAITARTFVYKKIEEGEDIIHKGADICTNFKHCQAYTNKEDILASWGEDANKNWEKISNAVCDTKDKLIYFKDDLILPVFHANSVEKTESSKEIWGHEDLPYLVSVESKTYEDPEMSKSCVELLVDEFKEKLQQKYGDMNFSTSIFSDIKEIVRNESGRVKYVYIAGTKISGEEMRNIFSLKSTNFKIINIGHDKIKIEVLGSGHGVGLSQVGANEMAKQGKTYQEILKHYYKNVDIR